MSADVETIVVGAGVVGLAVARALALAGHETMVLEQHALIGSETSSRNSEVIHAGIYYPPGSLRASLCVRGKELLYAFCAENNVPHARCGKLLVATSESQLPKLAAIKETAAKNGVTDLEPMGGNAARALEPEVACVGALVSPSTAWSEAAHLTLGLRASQPFRPLWRLTIVRYGEVEWRLVWTYHHSIVDGRAVALLLREVFTFYDGFTPDFSWWMRKPHEAAEKALEDYGGRQRRGAYLQRRKHIERHQFDAQPDDHSHRRGDRRRRGHRDRSAAQRALCRLQLNHHPCLQ
jgi:hypothetical protein